MKTAEKVQTNAEDIYEEAKQINEERAAAEDALYEDAECEETTECEETSEDEEAL